ncbi:trypsin-like peptidase domain-containing protein [Streptomyces caniscabiei]|uniref:S1C family serine protease n=1 Tax=Streptomyces caniscabiei TaxID=2746961 RepID=UPI0029A72323|nr:trypsin-like peptidase domain-containing protein [Streptomyces caniscabiei]MDX2776230.1 trypsin-like peptidase domain-containing protein [Streptomyces caniscabiei]
MNSMDEQKDVEPKKQVPPTGDTSHTERVVRPKRRTGLIVGGIVAALLFCGAIGVTGAQLLSSWWQNNADVTTRQETSNDGNKVVTQEEEDIASVVSKVSPSVVSIITTTQTRTPYYGSQSEEGAGTGIIVSKDGYILTNKHVVNGVDTVGVVLADGTKYDNVKVLGVDPLNDVAFLKVPDVHDLAAAELGDSTSVRVGQKVIAIGNSLGQYENTVTSGIISGTNRQVSAQSGASVETLTDLIQTDAAINPGNSGGPLLNLQGQVIGINTAIAEDAQGIGFAVPIGSAKGLLKEVLAGGEVKRAYLGVNYISITADVAKEYNLSVKRGAYVFSGNGKSPVASGSPADKAGVKDKDIITKVGNIEVGDRGSVSSLVGEYAPGDTIELTILRGGETLTVRVTLAAYQG